MLRVQVAPLPEPPPEVGLVRARKRRLHHGLSRNSPAQLPVLRQFQNQLDPPGCEKIGRSVHVTVRMAFAVTLRMAFRLRLPADRARERVVLRPGALALAHRQATRSSARLAPADHGSSVSAR